LATQLSEHCRFLHHHKICHRDIKPSNLALDDNQNLVVLDCDLMQQFLEGSIVHSFRGTKEFCKPEYYSHPECGFDVFEMELYSVRKTIEWMEMVVACGHEVSGA
jgi:serine/threonine protein kinase